MSLLIDQVEKGHIPDALTRLGIRHLLKQRLAKETRQHSCDPSSFRMIEAMSQSPLAINTADANLQHYEVPAAFYELVLGDHMKYSCCLYSPGVDNLSTAEELMLRLSCERADLGDDMDILELGCGWGSLTLWMGANYPHSRISAVSNSASQKAYIEAEADSRGINNIEVITCDMKEFETSERFDRVVSIEMFEHMRNHELLFERIASWLRPTGRLWFHIFCHQGIPYFFENEGESDWMARHFFSGGLMPSWDLPLQIPSKLTLQNRWAVSGLHYARTSRAWLDRLDHNRRAALAVFESSPDPTSASVLLNRWRMFFMACEELFAYNRGNEWHVGHYLFAKSE